jgi:oxygen-independent coproporphyrinogen III oxidase
VTLGIYFHVPFCQTKCNYCHFISVPFHGATANRYQTALKRELELCMDCCADNGDVDSIYFGGGTPSLLPSEYIADVLDCCHRLLPVSADCEISLEANPGTIPSEKATAFQQCGVNRISLGAQSFENGELTSIGRCHTSEMIVQSLSQLRAAGFRNINLDLMLGLPGQTAETWRKNLRIIGQLETPHLSVYMLDLDEQCPLAGMVASGCVQLPDEDLISDLYLETIDVLSRLGYLQYEISNFALPGFRCRHNLKYWQRKPVHGLGVGSHSFDGKSRYSNCTRLQEYFEAVDKGASPINWREPVGAAQSLSESLFLGLRLTQGLDWNQLQCIYGRECLARYESELRELALKGLLEWNGASVRLMPSGMLVSNEIFQLFI